MFSWEVGGKPTIMHTLLWSENYFSKIGAGNPSPATPFFDTDFWMPLFGEAPWTSPSRTRKQGASKTASLCVGISCQFTRNRTCKALTCFKTVIGVCQVTDGFSTPQLSFSRVICCCWMMHRWHRGQFLQFWWAPRSWNVSRHWRRGFSLLSMEKWDLTWESFCKWFSEWVFYWGVNQKLDVFREMCWKCKLLRHNLHCFPSSHLYPTLDHSGS